MSGRKHSGGKEIISKLPESSAEPHNEETSHSEGSQRIKQLLLAGWPPELVKPFTVETLLNIAGAALEPLFHNPPVGPIPEYLLPHHYVHGCVAEYEERFEELDRWKVRQLCSWLIKIAGEDFTIKGKVYKLCLLEGTPDTPDHCWFQMNENSSATNAE